MYTVKQLADLAHISVRTLHYYDTIGLLAPSQIGANGYRYYDEDAVLKLQQILFFRELDVSLSAIKAILDRPDFDVVTALHAHRAALHDRMERLNTLIQTVDSTILHLTGEVAMSKKKLFTGFTAEEEERYTEQARELYGADEVNASYKRWNSYTPQQKDAIKAEGGAIYADIAAAIESGQSPDSADVQACVARWHQHLRYFYEPSIERLRGLGQLYVDSPDFAANLSQFHAELPAFMQRAITIYCDGLEGSA